MVNKRAEELWNHERGDCGQPPLRGTLSAGLVGLGFGEHPAWGDDELEPDGAGSRVAALDGSFAALKKTGQGVGANNDLAAAACLLRVQRLHLRPTQEGVRRDSMSLKDVEVGAGSSRHDDVEVVLATGPGSGAGVGAWFGALAPYGGSETPAGEYRAVAVSDREDPTGMVSVDDAAGPDRQESKWCRCDTTARRGHDGVVQYSEGHFFLTVEERTTKALAGLLRE